MHAASSMAIPQEAPMFRDPCSGTYLCSFRLRFGLPLFPFPWSGALQHTRSRCLRDQPMSMEGEGNVYSNTLWILWLTIKPIQFDIRISVTCFFKIWCNFPTMKYYLVVVFFNTLPQPFCTIPGLLPLFSKSPWSWTHQGKLTELPTTTRSKALPWFFHAWQVQQKVDQRTPPLWAECSLTLPLWPHQGWIAAALWLPWAPWTIWWHQEIENTETESWRTDPWKIESVKVGTAGFKHGIFWLWILSHDV